MTLGVKTASHRKSFLPPMLLENPNGGGGGVCSREAGSSWKRFAVGRVGGDGGGGAATSRRDKGNLLYFLSARTRALLPRQNDVPVGCSVAAATRRRRVILRCDGLSVLSVRARVSPGRSGTVLSRPITIGIRRRRRTIVVSRNHSFAPTSAAAISP